MKHNVPWYGLIFFGLLAMLAVLPMQKSPLPFTVSHSKVK